MPNSFERIIEEQILREEHEEIMITENDELLEILSAEDMMFNAGEADEDFDDDEILDYVDGLE